MWGHDLVLDAKVIQCQDIFGGSALKRIQILHLKVIFYPFKFKTRSIGHESLQMRFVQQIIYSLFVYLKIWTVDCELFAPGAALLFYHFKHKADASWYNTLILSSFHHRNRLPFIICTILVTFHRESLSGTCLAISKDGWVVALRQGVRNEINGRKSDLLQRLVWPCL